MADKKCELAAFGDFGLFFGLGVIAADEGFGHMTR
jgi:hypothetical protein